MSSYKRRHKDQHSPSDEAYKAKKKTHHGSDDSSYYSEHRRSNYVDSVNLNNTYDRDNEDYIRDKRKGVSKGKKSHEKTKRSELYDSYDEQHPISKKRHSESSEHTLLDKKGRRDYDKIDNNYQLYNQDARTKDESDDGSYHSRNKVKDRNLESSSLNRKEKRCEKSDHGYEPYNRDIRRSKVASNDYDYSRSREKVRRKHDSNHENTSFRNSNHENASFRTTHNIDHDNLYNRTVADKVNQDVQNEGNGHFDSHSDAQKEGNNKKSTAEVNKAPKKMISGAYIPPAKLKLMQQEITDKGSIEYQKISWEALKKSINGLTNKVNTSNIADIVKELFKENIIRGRGVLTRALMQAQTLSPTFTHVYAALVAVINTKFPEISELLLKRLMLQFKRGFRRNDKQACLSSVRFIAHLLNQQVAHEVLVLEIFTLLVENPTDHSVEVAIAMLKECGMKLKKLSPKGADGAYTRLRHVLHEANLDKRTQYMIEVMFAVIKDKYKDYPDVIQELDLVEENDKFTHMVNLDEAVDAEEILNVFKFDPDYEANEERYKNLVKEILGESDSEESGGSEAEESDSQEENDDEGGENQEIVDMTETNLVALRRKIYLTIQSSLDFEECAHKLLRMELKPGEIMEMCYMILDCCSQQRTYEKFYGLLAQRFCQLNKVYLEPFMEIFRNSYETIHRLETNKLRNVAKFFAHLLYTDAIHWHVLSNIRLNENDTTSSSRIFIKILFQELCDYMGLPLLNERVKDVTLQEAFDGLFPRDNPHNTRFAINFFTSIGLGGLTDELREHLKTAPKNPVITTNEKPPEVSPEDTSSEDSPSSSSSSSASSSSSDSDTEEDEPSRKKNRKKTTSTRQNHKKNSSTSIDHKNYKKLNETKHKQKRRH